MPPEDTAARKDWQTDVPKTYHQLPRGATVEYVHGSTTLLAARNLPSPVEPHRRTNDSHAKACNLRRDDGIL